MARKYQAIACKWEVWSLREDGVTLNHIISRHVLKERADKACEGYSKYAGVSYKVMPV